MQQTERAYLATSRAPRYTSFPTAVQFGPEVDAAVHGAWLADLPPGRPISLYVHVPFCRRLCWYCGCSTRVANGRAPVDDYMNTLLAELELVAARMGRRSRVSAVHLGGGSPNALSPEDLDRLFDAIGARFGLSGQTEIAAEIDPSHVDSQWIAAAARRGLSRASLGVQEFSPRVQRAINRVQPFEVVERVVGELRSRGVDAINFDLMYGLPHQSRGDLLATIQASLRLAPERLAVFGYAHVPWMRPNQKLIDSRALPGPAERLEQRAAANESLASAGYVAIGIDHFAKAGDALAIAQSQGRLRRNFQGYTTDQAPSLIGLGPSAISHTPAGYAQNAVDVVAWRSAVKAGRLATTRGVELTWSDRLRAEIIERLMCDFTADLAEICRQHGGTMASLESDLGRLATVMRSGLARLVDGRILVSESGRPFTRLICTAFDPYFDPAGGRHAIAA